ncbi:hypothetical protein BCR34DRAFT_675636 [Clohesyomyces aquaticus]|uniref:ubiquitinyl hydrolase 1 n=1 Tax=Clohesyomyces aquaticus TaxID=1231657 RepID=A0A1Y1Z6Q3_9PLEO|nr:hypothetical protein BCR34DRAFT_675636 [Clohesyomyces aquaticus]
MFSLLYRQPALSPVYSLPQNGEDPQAVAHETTLLGLVLDGVGRFKAHVAAEYRDSIDSALRGIARLQDMRSVDGSVNETKLLDYLCDLDKEGDFLPIHVKGQNAAVIATRQQHSKFFAGFELSPKDRDVICSKGRLRRCFPEFCVSVPMKTLEEYGCRVHLARTMSKMSCRRAEELKIKGRDQSDSRSVTELLGTILAVMGDTAPILNLWKNTREEVLWWNATVPQTRTPVQLLVRVALQRSLCCNSNTSSIYKEFLGPSISQVSGAFNLPSDWIYCMTAKLSRRLLKLDQNIEYHWLKDVDIAIRNARETITDRWKVISDEPNSVLGLEPLQNMKFENDVAISHPQLDHYIRQVGSFSTTVSQLSFEPPILGFQYARDTLPSLPTGIRGEGTGFRLLAFEQWIKSSLSSWLDSQSTDEEACGKLNQAMQSYYGIALQRYHGCPEGLSVMILTTVEMWIGIDKLTTWRHGLISDCDPGIRCDHLQSLIVPLKREMERLNEIEKYVQSCWDCAIPDYPSIFSSFGQENYLKQIATQAEIDKEKKRAEFNKLKAKYDRLQILSDTMKCDFDKCALKRRAEGFTIQLYEYPLPKNTFKAQSTVFELRVPRPFNDWRNATLFILFEALGSAYDNPVSPKIQARLAHYLPSHYIPVYRRITLISNTKSKPGLSTETSESEVILDNGLNYHYYDVANRSLVVATCNTDDIPHMCTYSLSKGCSTLQKFLFRPFHMPNGISSNNVISRQEFKAMAALPVGYRIQWSNVLTQLHIPVMEFKKRDTVLMLLQISRQAGPPLQNSAFATSFLDESWESCQNMYALIALGTRVLTLAISPAVISRSLDLLNQSPSATLRWIHRLQDNAKQTFEVACACVDSFDVDDNYLQNLLANHAQASILIEASIVIQDTLHSALRSGDDHRRRALQRWTRLLFRSYPILLAEISRGQHRCLDIAIYLDGTGYWVTARTAQAPNGKSFTLHYNLLTAELLVDGVPLSRLPPKYQQHPRYETLFGKVTLKVMPSSLPGMQFSTRKPHRGYTLHFGISDTFSDNLFLVATKDTGMFDLIPPVVFENKLPHHFIHDYTHWHNRKSRTIEFRPKGSPWESSPIHWTMKNEGTFWTMRKDDQFLLNSVGPSAKYLSSLMVSLESADHIHHLLDCGANRLEVQSRQYRGFSVDPSQSPGTLCGLVSKMVLRNAQNRRKVLILDGKASWGSSSTGHIQVSVQHGTSRKVYQFEIDTLLGRLVGTGDLQSPLILARFHALTSYSLPDPLTGKTGTEEAISILTSSSVRSFDSLSQNNLDVLFNIAKFTPARTYFPTYDHVMENVAWDTSLSFLSQHGWYYTCVKSLLDQASSTKFFYPSQYIEPNKLDRVDAHLGQRHLVRTATYRVCGNGAEDHTTEFDASYVNLEHQLPSERSTLSREIGILLCKRAQSLPQAVVPNLEDHLWKLLNEFQDTQGPKHPLSTESIGYDDTKHSLRQYLCRFHRVFGNQPTVLNKYQVMICLATLAYAKEADGQAMQMLAAFYNIPSVGSIEIPDFGCFQLYKDRKAKTSSLRSILKKHRLPFENSTESILQIMRGETHAQLHVRRKGVFEEKQQKAINEFMTAIEAQWVRETPRTPNGKTVKTYVNVTAAMVEVELQWKQWYRNHLFYEYLRKISKALQKCAVKPILGQENQIRTSPAHQSRNTLPFIAEQDLFEHQAPVCPDIPDTTSELVECVGIKTPRGQSMIRLVQQLRQQAVRPYEDKYVQDLRDSLSSLREHNAGHVLCSMGPDALGNLLRQNLGECKAAVDHIYQSLQTAVGVKPDSLFVENDYSIRDTAMAAMPPRISPLFFLQQLTVEKWKLLSQQWKSALISYGIALKMLQRAERLIKARHNEVDLLQELQNIGHTNWNPGDRPEILLLEVESGIMIRAVQEDIAAMMRAPPEDENAVMQLNMGEGKSSVIAPMIAAHLANGSMLVRVIVGKPQAKELFRIPSSRLGGLLGHRIYQMPFSRSLALSTTDAQEVDRLYRECAQKRGILLLQPEHILSFKLIGLECLISGEEELGRVLLVTQHFFDNESRDIVDESDENFSPKFELIYTMGTQRPIGLSLERWYIIQRVLGIVARVGVKIQKDLPMSEISQEICNTGLHGLPITRQGPRPRESVYGYITEAKPWPDEIETIEESTYFKESGSQILFLLRDLFAKGVLGFAFCQKRWRVNYGLDLNRRPRTRLAVPYRAKDSPSARAEFSHPDVVIILTCLSYHYGGLSDEDLFLAFDRLVMSDQADMEYYEWVRDAPNLDTSFHRLAGVNLKDRVQNVVDYFLAFIVHPTTGLSGTNDSRHLLPLDVAHLDLEKQRHTNALVLEQLLQPENTVALMERARDTDGSDAEILLRLVTSMVPDVQVVLDVGAQILELTDIQVAKAWLHILSAESGINAVIFFNESDDLCVIDHVCLVFLDESHTRGTDLKLPDYYRAAVTLGANLTKERLVQACMRIIKLGRGQSVVFCIPEEIQTKIRVVNRSRDNRSIGVSDFLRWSVSETWADLRRGMGLWAIQGARSQRQKKMWAEATTSTNIYMTQGQAEMFLEDEAETLERRYKPVNTEDAGNELDHLFLDANVDSDLTAIERQYKAFATTDIDSSSLQEEQEREVAPEIEQERQKFPCSIYVTEDYKRTVKLGDLDPCVDSYQRPIQWVLTSNGGGNAQRVKNLVIISPYEVQELMPKIKESKRLKLFTIPSLPTTWHLPDALRLQLNLFAGQLYFGSYEDYEQTSEDGLEVEEDGFMDKKGVNGSSPKLKQSPVPFLKVFLSKIRRDCEDIGKTHWGRILGGEILTLSDFPKQETDDDVGGGDGRDEAGRLGAK